MPNIGSTEILLLLLLALLLFGAKRLPEIGRSMGRGMREFKDSITGKDDDKEKMAELPPPSATTVSTMSMPDEDDVAEARAEHAAAAERLKEAEEQLRSLEAKH
jgi:sec-independent protein translocase protein TatA